MFEGKYHCKSVTHFRLFCDGAAIASLNLNISVKLNKIESINNMIYFEE